MGFKKWVIPEIDKQIAYKLAEECNIEPFLALMAYSRGYKDPFALDEFIIKDLPDIDIYALPDIEKAANRILSATNSGEKIVVYGDYDCDGVTATALMYLFLTEMGANVDYYVPSRHNEGYGMHMDAIKKLADKDTKLIITVDNGISATAEIDYANSLGIETIVTDHHLPKDVLPNAVAVINPHRDDCFLDFKDFAGVGVAFILALAVSGSSPDVLLNKYSDLVALGTVADVMPLKHENRGLVWYGLNKINRNASTGIKALMAASGAKFGEITAGTLAFTAAPRLNAAGRMGDATRAVKLLISEKYSDAMQIAAELDDENAARQKTEQDIAAAATEIVINNKLYNNRVIVVAGDGWHEGVLGIAAARLAERFERPTILLSRDDENSPYKGSARTVGDFSIFSAIDSAGELTVKYGGHDKAAGLTILADNLNAFIEKINEYAANTDLPIPTINIDCRLNPVAAVPDLVYTLSPLEPYGTENPKPVFGLFEMRLKTVSSIGGGKHIRLIAEKNNTTIAMVMFGVTKDDFAFSEGDLLDFAVTLDVKEYQGQEQLSVFVKDVRKSGRIDDEVISQLLLTENYINGTLDCEDAALLTFSREELIPVYLTVKNGANTVLKLKNRLDAVIDAKISVMLDVMVELGLISVTGYGDNAKINILNSQKVELENSNILKSLNERAVTL